LSISPVADEQLGSGTPTVTQLLNYLPVGVLYNNLAVTKFIIVTASDGAFLAIFQLLMGMANLSTKP
jgi:hypothetical protein